MYVVRNVFRAKPGKATDLAQRFKAAAPHLEAMIDGQTRVLTDVVSGFWTVVVESEVEDLGGYLDQSRGATSSEEVRDIMSGYMELVEGGHREIFKVE